MIRAALAVTAGLLCGVMGIRHARQLNGTAFRLRRWEELLRHLALLLSEGDASMPDVFEQAASAHEAPDELLCRLARQMREQPMSTLPDLYAACQNTCEEDSVLTRLMARLGRGSLETRRQAVEQAADEIALLSASATTKAATDARMWTTLGWTCGACLTLMLI